MHMVKSNHLFDLQITAIVAHGKSLDESNLKKIN